MPDRLTYEELSALMKSGAGLTVDASEMESSPGSAFEEYGLDSLGLLGIVAALENRYGRPLPADADRCKTPGEFLDLVNTTLTGV
ncbi:MULTISPECIES: acyl carrier protein [Streptomyces]|uniref:Acyl carrier protein n=1 Tax=Streptomyces halstedii TaxID=1944 RepID=A0A6N9U4V7_STRHA|nr:MULTISPECIES: acyl carrier protein [Streptomyces]AWL36753.1 acyl carrier protein [Streptomyces sp. SM18]MBV7673201.1 acyl carrier protein [Streptomyces halstedii]NEA15875.1 acyl carrier protein [Streptomyces halstedii]